MHSMSRYSLRPAGATCTSSPAPRRRCWRGGVAYAGRASLEGEEQVEALRGPDLAHLEPRGWTGLETLNQPRKKRVVSMRGQFTLNKRLTVRPTSGLQMREVRAAECLDLLL